MLQDKLPLTQHTLPSNLTLKFIIKFKIIFAELHLLQLLIELSFLLNLGGNKEGDKVSLRLFAPLHIIVSELLHVFIIVNNR